MQEEKLVTINGITLPVYSGVEFEGQLYMLLSEKVIGMRADLSCNPNGSSRTIKTPYTFAEKDGRLYDVSFFYNFELQKGDEFTEDDLSKAIISELRSPKVIEDALDQLKNLKK